MWRRAHADGCAKLRNWSNRGTHFSDNADPYRTTTADSPPTPQQGPKIHRVEVYWHAVTYKTVAVYLVLLFVIIIAGMYVAIPDWTTIATNKLNKAIGNIDNDPLTITQTQAKFVNLDGRVQVKKVNSVTWVDADYHTALDKGDLVQTGSDGAARITFADGTEYTVNAETLVTVEENNVTRDRSNTAVRINTGASGPGYADVDAARLAGGDQCGRCDGDTCSKTAARR